MSGSAIVVTPITPSFDAEALNRPDTFGAIFSPARTVPLRAIASIVEMFEFSHRHNVINYSGLAILAAAMACPSSRGMKAKPIVDHKRDLSREHAKGRPRYFQTSKQESIRRYRLAANDLQSKDEDSEETSATGDAILCPDLAIGGIGIDKTVVVTLTAEHKVHTVDRPPSVIAYGFTQGLVQLLSAHEAFGTFLSYFMVNLFYGRIILVRQVSSDEVVVAVEAAKTLRRRLGGTPLSHRQTMEDQHKLLGDLVPNALGDPIDETVNCEGTKRFCGHLSTAIRLLCVQKFASCQPLSTIHGGKNWLPRMHMQPHSMTRHLNSELKGKMSPDSDDDPNVEDDCGDGEGQDDATSDDEGPRDDDGRCGDSAQREAGDGGPAETQPGDDLHNDLPTTHYSCDGLDDGLPDPHAPPPDSDSSMELDMVRNVDIPLGAELTAFYDHQANLNAIEDYGIKIMLISPEEMDELVLDAEREYAQMVAAATTVQASELESSSGMASASGSFLPSSAVEPGGLHAARAR